MRTRNLKLLPLLIAALLSACGDQAQIEADVVDSEVSLSIADAGVSYMEESVMSIEAEDNMEYGCAKVYLQIPRQVTNPDTGESYIQIYHELWSVPVQKLPGNDVWTSIKTDFNTVPPENEAADIKSGDSGYAFILLESGYILYDQLVRAVPQSKDWYVCENYYCGQNGCQDHDNFDSSKWICNPSQERLLHDEQFEKCPCSFNSSGYPHCGFE